MPRNEDLWYRIGYALEAARQRLPPAPPPESGVRKGKGPAPLPAAGEKIASALRKAQNRTMDEASSKILDAFLTVGAGTVLTRLLSFWPGRRRPGLLRLLKAGAAGAAASFLAELVRPALTGEASARTLEEELTDILLSGAGRGLLYAAIVEPRVPGPSILQGTTYGALEYALTPWGGLEGLAGQAAPHRKIPVLSVLLQNRGEEEQFLEHLAFGIALALLYEP
ncbi:MAG: hypothetical protein ACWGSQ_02315 [Longimicrobiales bacterium]